MATGLKRIAERLLAASPIGKISLMRTAPATVVLAYHNIVPSGAHVCGDRSLHLDQSAFGAQLDLLSRLGSIVDLNDALTPRDPSDRVLRIVVTFDDAYRGTMTAGIEELAARGLPATVFVPPGLLGSEGFWWDRVSTQGKTGLDPALRAHALETLEGRGDRILMWATDSPQPPMRLPDHARPVTETELLSDNLPGNITFGAHTWSHANLAALSPEIAEEEMVRSKEWLASRTDRYVDWISYPYGLWNPSVARIAGHCFSGALLVDGGLVERHGVWASPMSSIPRVNVPRGISLEGLKLRVTGLLA